MLVDDGVLQRRGGRWRVVRELSEVAIPPTIRALLASRLDRLSPAERWCWRGHRSSAWSSGPLRSPSSAWAVGAEIDAHLEELGARR